MVAPEDKPLIEVEGNGAYGVNEVAHEQISARLEREIEKVGIEIDKLSSKLGNTKFISRAPEHVVEELTRPRVVEMLEQRALVAPTGEIVMADANPVVGFELRATLSPAGPVNRNTAGALTMMV